MKKLHGLVISWFYPPGNSSEGLVTYKLLKNSNLTYDVFTRSVQNATIWDRKTKEDDLVSKNVNIIKSDATKAKEWINDAVEYFRANSDKYDFIMSRIMGVEAHEAAILIKQEFPDIKWIASFGDPLVDSPYIPNPPKRKNPFYMREYVEREALYGLRRLKVAASPTRRARRLIWEKDRQEKAREARRLKSINDRTFELANKLIFNNNYQYNLAFSRGMSQYKKKGVVIPHSFDLDLYPEPKEKKRNDKLTFTYVGHLDKLRNASSLFEAIGKLKSHDEELDKKAHFNFYGHMSNIDKANIINNKLSKIVDVYDDVDYKTSLEKILNSDWLILIDANLNEELTEYIYFPAKLADYMGAKKNILAITQLEGATADIMRDVKAGQIVTHSADDISIYLAKIIYQNYSPAKYVEKEWRKFDARNVAAKFDKIVEKMLDD